MEYLNEFWTYLTEKPEMGIMWAIATCALLIVLLFFYRIIFPYKGFRKSLSREKEEKEIAKVLEQLKNAGADTQLLMNYLDAEIMKKAKALERREQRIEELSQKLFDYEEKIQGLEKDHPGLRIVKGYTWRGLLISVLSGLLLGAAALYLLQYYSVISLFK